MINKQGTPLDAVENLLISNRKRPVAIAARSIIRAGTGHKYWSRFDAATRKAIEEKAGALYRLLFEPEIETPIKTLDLPLGGGVGVRAALELLIDFILVANRNQEGKPVEVKDQSEDPDGDNTLQALERTRVLAHRITGNDGGSLGLHPAVYFYGPSGRHIAALFMGLATVIAGKIINNDQQFFSKFTACRRELEEGLLLHKALLASIISRINSAKRYTTAAALFDYLIESYSSGVAPSEQDLVDKAGVTGKIFVGAEYGGSQKFSPDTKSAVYLREALQNALRCAHCSGYLDPNKSVSYDHKIPVREGGTGKDSNCQLMHPYCNQSAKG